MKLIDMHCDTIGKILDIDKQGTLLDNLCSVNLTDMKKADSFAQFFA